MEVCANCQDGVVYLTLRGEIDEHNAVSARKKADAIADECAGSKSAVFDLKEVTFMDSTAIGFLIGRYKKFKRYGVPTYLTNPSQSADKILTISGVYALMPKI